MAKKRRRRYDCFTCGKRFDGPQALFGHRRHCPRLKRQAEAQPQSQPPATSRLTKRPGPLSQEGKLISLDALEGLEECLQKARHFATAASIWANMNVQGQYDQAKAWAEIYLVLEDCHRDLESMLPVFRLDRGVLFGIYQCLRMLKKRWIDQRLSELHCPALEPDGLTEGNRTLLREEEAQLTRLIDQFKRLVAAAP